MTGLIASGIINDMLIGPAIVEDRITGDSYLHFLQNDVPEQLEDFPLETRRHMYLQHDGSLIQYTRMVTEHLNNTYPNRWIGQGFIIHFPARSSVLTFWISVYGDGTCTAPKWIHVLICNSK